MKFNRTIAIAVTAVISASVLFGVMLVLLLTGKYIVGAITAIIMLCCVYVSAGILGGME